MTTTQTDKAGLSRFAIVFFIVCFLSVVFFLYLVFRPFFATFVWAGILTVVFQPLFRSLNRVFHGRRTMASSVSCLLILLLIVLPVTLIGFLLSQQSVALYHNLQVNVGDAPALPTARLHQLESHPWVLWILSQTGDRPAGAENVSLQQWAKETLGTISKFVVSRVPSVLVGMAGILYQFLLMFIVMFFLFRDGAALVEFVKASNPLPEAYEEEIAKKFRDLSYATFFGSILTAIVQGSAGAVLFWGLRIPSPLFWGALIAFVSLVPIVGAFLVWLPVSTYLFLTGDTTRGIALLAIGGIVVSSIDNVLKPLIIKGRTDMHPLLVFLSVLGGMEVFGFLGILLGPFLVAVFLSFLNFYKLEFHDSLNKQLSGVPGQGTED